MFFKPYNYPSIP